MAVVLCLLAVLPVAPAQASTRDKIIRDCSDGRLDATYSPSDLRDARQHLPSDVAEYTDCADVLRSAEIPDTPSGSAGGTPGGPGGSGGTPGGTAGGAPGTAPPGGGTGGGLLVPATPDDFKALADAETAGSHGAVVAGRRVAPGLSTGAIRNDVPDTVLVALILLAVVALALAVPAARRGLPRAAPLPWRRSAP
jgi:hypothetical protein